MALFLKDAIRLNVYQRRNTNCLLSNPDISDAFLTALHDGDARVRIAVVKAIGDLRDECGPFVPVIITMLQDCDENIREAASRTLLQLASDHSSLLLPFLDEIIESLNDDDMRVRANSANSVSRLGGEAKRVGPLLGAMLMDHARPVRYAACEAIGRIG